MRIALVTLLAAFCLTAISNGSGGRADDEATIKKEREKFRGAWRFERVEAGGLEVPGSLFKGDTIVFEEGRFTVKRGEEVLGAGTYEFNLSESPKTLDMTVTSGQSKGKVRLGIYEITADALIICLEAGGKNRPTEFKSSVSNTQALFVHKRVKK